MNDNRGADTTKYLRYEKHRYKKTLQRPSPPFTAASIITQRNMQSVVLFQLCVQGTFVFWHFYVYVTTIAVHIFGICGPIRTNIIAKGTKLSWLLRLGASWFLGWTNKQHMQVDYWGLVHRGFSGGPTSNKCMLIIEAWCIVGFRADQQATNVCWWLRFGAQLLVHLGFWVWPDKQCQAWRVTKLYREMVLLVASQASFDS